MYFFVNSFASSIDLKLVIAMKRSQTKPLSPDNVFWGWEHIFNVIILYPTSQLVKLLYSSIYFITVGNINEVSYLIMTLLST